MKLDAISMILSKNQPLDKNSAAKRGNIFNDTAFISDHTRAFKDSLYESLNSNAGKMNENLKDFNAKTQKSMGQTHEKAILKSEENAKSAPSASSSKSKSFTVKINETMLSSTETAKAEHSEQNIYNREAVNVHSEKTAGSTQNSVNELPPQQMKQSPDIAGDVQKRVNETLEKSVLNQKATEPASLSESDKQKKSSIQPVNETKDFNFNAENTEKVSKRDDVISQSSIDKKLDLKLHTNEALVPSASDVESEFHGQTAKDTKHAHAAIPEPEIVRSKKNDYTLERAEKIENHSDYKQVNNNPADISMPDNENETFIQTVNETNHVHLQFAEEDQRQVQQIAKEQRNEIHNESDLKLQSDGAVSNFMSENEAKHADGSITEEYETKNGNISQVSTDKNHENQDLEQEQNKSAASPAQAIDNENETFAHAADELKHSNAGNAKENNVLINTDIKVPLNENHGKLEYGQEKSETEINSYTQSVNETKHYDNENAKDAETDDISKSKVQANEEFQQYPRTNEPGNANVQDDESDPFIQSIHETEINRSNIVIPKEEKTALLTNAQEPLTEENPNLDFEQKMGEAVIPSAQPVNEAKQFNREHAEVNVPDADKPIDENEPFVHSAHETNHSSDVNSNEEKPAILADAQEPINENHNQSGFGQSTQETAISSAPDNDSKSDTQPVDEEKHFVSKEADPVNIQVRADSKELINEVNPGINEPADANVQSNESESLIQSANETKHPINDVNPEEKNQIVAGDVKGPVNEAKQSDKVNDDLDHQVSMDENHHLNFQSNDVLFTSPPENENEQLNQPADETKRTDSVKTNDDADTNRPDLIGDNYEKAAESEAEKDGYIPISFAAENDHRFFAQPFSWAFNTSMINNTEQSSDTESAHEMPLDEIDENPQNEGEDLAAAFIQNHDTSEENTEQLFRPVFFMPDHGNRLFTQSLNNHAAHRIENNNEGIAEINSENLQLIKNELEKFDAKNLHSLLTTVQTARTLDGETKHLLQQMIVKLDEMIAKGQNYPQEMIKLLPDTVLNEIKGHIMENSTNPFYTEENEISTASVPLQSAGGNMQPANAASTESNLIHLNEWGQTAEQGTNEKPLFHFDRSRATIEQTHSSSTAAEDRVQTNQNSSEKIAFMSDLKSVQQETSYPLSLLNEKERSAQQLFAKAENLLQNVHSKREIAQIAPTLLSYLEEWQSLSQSKAGSKALITNLSADNKQALYTWQELVKAYQNRSGFTMHQYQFEAKVTTSDIIRWVSNHMETDNRMNQDKAAAQLAPVTAVPLSKVEQFVFHLNQAQSSIPADKQLIEQFQKLMDANRITNLQKAGTGLSITLKPHNLGEMQVRFNQVQGEMIVTIYVTTLKAKEMLEGNMQQLRSMFAPHQVTVERQEMIVQHNDNAQKNADHQDKGNEGKHEQSQEQNHSAPSDEEAFQLLFDELMVNEKV